MRDKPSTTLTIKLSVIGSRKKHGGWLSGRLSVGVRKPWFGKIFPQTGSEKLGNYI
jgi:hypothetical protein